MRPFLTYLGTVLVFQTFGCPGLGQSPDQARGLFLTHHKAALFRVEGASVLAEGHVRIGNILVTRKTVAVRLVVKEALPSWPVGRDFGLTIDQDTSLFGDVSGPDDWFPTKKGSLFVATFDVGEIREVRELQPLSLNEPAESVWRQCILFSRALGQRQQPTALALTKVMKPNTEDLGPAFFDLIFAYDRGLLDDTDLSLAAAAYLREKKVPVAIRVDTVGKLPKFVSRAPEANKALASAVVDLALEAKRANLEPLQIGNTLMLLSILFVANQPPSALPRLDEKTRQEVLRLAEDRKYLYDRVRGAYLLSWLDSMKPGPQGEAPAPVTHAEPVGLSKAGVAIKAPQTTPDESGDRSPVSLWLVLTLCAAAALLMLGALLFFRRRRDRA